VGLKRFHYGRLTKAEGPVTRFRTGGEKKSWTLPRGISSPKKRKGVFQDENDVHKKTSGEGEDKYFTS